MGMVVVKFDDGVEPFSTVAVTFTTPAPVAVTTPPVTFAPGALPVLARLKSTARLVAPTGFIIGTRVRLLPATKVFVAKVILSTGTNTSVTRKVSAVCVICTPRVARTCTVVVPTAVGVPSIVTLLLSEAMLTVIPAGKFPTIETTGESPTK
jgi:hypothetical protein